MTDPSALPSLDGEPCPYPEYYGPITLPIDPPYRGEDVASLAPEELVAALAWTQRALSALDNAILRERETLNFARRKIQRQLELLGPEWQPNHGPKLIRKTITYIDLEE